MCHASSHLERCILLLVLLLSIAACGGSPGAAPAKRGAPAGTSGVPPSAAIDAAPAPASATHAGGALRVAVPVDPETIDPHLGANTVHSVWMALVYETLIGLDKNGDPVPGIAKSWEVSDDGKTYTFALRDDVTWHNGRKLVADDVKFNYERIKNPANGATQSGQLSQITAIATPDEHTVVLKLSAPNAAILSELAVQGRVGLIAPESFDAQGNLKEPIGSGPFMLKSSDYVVNDRLNLTANKSYWGGPPLIDAIAIRVIPDRLARLSAVSNGEIDFGWDVPGLQATAEQQAGKIQLQQLITNEANWVAINQQNPKFADPRVRKAMLLAISRNDIVAGAWDGFATPVFQPFVEDSFWHVETPSQHIDAHMDEAKALMKEAGVSNLSLSILNWNAAGTEREAQIVASAWGELGIQAKVETVEIANILDQAKKGDFDVIYAFITFVYDPNRPYNYFNKDWNLNGLSGNIKSDKLTALFLKGQQISDPAERKKIYSELLNTMYEEEPGFMYTVRKTSFIALGKNVRGYQQGNLLAVNYAGGGILKLSLGSGQ